MKIKYESKSGVPLEILEKGDWVDLRLLEDANIAPGEFKALSTGIRMELPKGFEALVALRSSTGKRFRVLQYNAPGVVDNSYCGPEDIWHILLYAPDGTFIKAGERIAQFRIQPKMRASMWTKLRWLFTSKVHFIQVSHIKGKTNRGGLGSTNKPI